MSPGKLSSVLPSSETRPFQNAPRTPDFRPGSFSSPSGSPHPEKYQPQRQRRRQDHKKRLLKSHQARPPHTLNRPTIRPGGPSRGRWYGYGRRISDTVYLPISSGSDGHTFYTAFH